MLSDNLDAEMKESRSVKVAEKPQTIEDINYAIRDKEHQNVIRDLNQQIQVLKEENRKMILNIQTKPNQTNNSQDEVSRHKAAFEDLKQLLVKTQKSQIKELASLREE